MELLIDGSPCDLGTARVTLPARAAAAADIETCRAGRSLRIAIPATERNDRILSFARDPHAAVRFNDALHRAEVRCAGATLLEGRVRLMASSEEGHELEIRESGTGWAVQAAQRRLGDLGIDFRATLDPVTICRSWREESPVRFFPIHRDAYPQRSDPYDLLPAERILSTDDYHPFLHVATLVERIFAEAGYTLRSRFFAGAFFRSLYLSGAYPVRDTTAADSRMGFFARRLGPATASADDIGRVYADPRALAHTVGNIVETATPLTPDADGEPIPELRNNGGCFAMADGAIRFTPPVETTAGFEYRLRYTTDHRILSRRRLRGFDTLYLGPGSELSFSLANRYEDRRGAIRPGYEYRAVVFDHAAGAQYRLTCMRDGVPGHLLGTFAARSALVTTPSGATLSEPVLEERGGGVWTAATGDWALYDGHVGETGRTTVELRVRTVARSLSPASPVRFDLVYFAGAEPGMRLTLHKETSLRTCFVTGPGYGAPVTFADVTHHGFRQSALLEALAHMFNLRFLTEAATRRVWVEPADDFRSGGTVDWSDRTDFSQPVEIADRVTGEHRRRVWCYRAGEGAVARFDAGAPDPSGTGPAGVLGAWCHATDSPAALEGTERRTNPLFHPSLNVADSYRNAPSASMLSVGDRDAVTAAEELTPRIVRYAGLRPLPEGERWGHPWNEASYPLAAFHFAGDASTAPFTLCFEDRDGAEGLHRRYDREAEASVRRQRITLSLCVEPHELEALFTPGVGAADLRARFLIDTGQGIVRAVLRRVEAYEPGAPSVRCVFDREIED